MDIQPLHANDSKSIIARKLILYIVLFSASITVVATGIQFYTQYRQEVSAIDSRLDQIKTGHMGGIVTATWIDDKEQINAILTGIVGLPDIEYAEVRVNGNTLVSSGTEPVSRTIDITFPLQHLYRSRLITIGEMRVSASLAGVHKRLLGHTGMAFVSNAVVISLLALFFYMLFNKLVTRHLHNMAAFAGRLNIENLDDQLDLKKKRRSLAAYDEIDVLADALSRMQGNLRTSVNNLKQSELRIKLLMDSAGEGIYGVNLHGECTFANNSCTQLLGLKDPEELLGKNMHQLIHHSHQDGSEYSGEDCNVDRAHREGASVYADDEVFWRQDGVAFPVEYRAHPIIYDDQILGSVVSFNDISDRKNAERKLLDAHEELEDKVLKRTEALSRAKDEAETANRAKTVFLSSMSHELRTPLNAIMGFAQLLELDTDQLNEAQCEAVEHILNGGRHLLELINDVLDLARIESGHFALSIEDVSLKAILDDSVRMLEATAAENDISVEIRHPGAELPMVRADNVRLKQVVLNFLSNAIKYNRKGGKVTVEFEEIPGHFLRVLVNDTGQGIPARYQRDLFKPFSRLGAEAGEIEGTGIGLTISKELIKLMEGNLGFDTVEGRGSTFWFELPLAGVLESRDSTVSQSNLDRDHPEDKSGTTLSGARKIMYVEDNSANLELMENIIAQIPNVQFMAAHTAERGIALARQEKPDLILMDINLPGMDGHEALGKLKQTPETADIPVIAVTANAMTSHLEKAERSAFVSYIIKPFNVADILKSIKDAIKMW